MWSVCLFCILYTLTYLNMDRRTQSITSCSRCFFGDQTTDESFLHQGTASRKHARERRTRQVVVRHGIRFQHGRKLLVFMGGLLAQSLRGLLKPQPVSRMFVVQPCATEQIPSSVASIIPPLYFLTFMCTYARHPGEAEICLPISSMAPRS